MDTGTWLTPLVLLPGVAMLVMSTSVRYGQIHQEFHRLVGEMASANDPHTDSLMHRAKLFRNALVGLYTSVTALAVSGMVGGISTVLGGLVGILVCAVSWFIVGGVGAAVVVVVVVGGMLGALAYRGSGSSVIYVTFLILQLLLFLNCRSRLIISWKIFRKLQKSTCNYETYY